MTTEDWLRILDVVVIAFGLSLLAPITLALVETFKRWRREE